jgi:alkanesulfonate monooxygenase SsuD/methylene tetrahydromethanopterin reductase-like flavin-dependent oxidoreductase (luciferase family)
MTPFDRGQVSLRMYPHVLPANECVAELLRQARLAEDAGFDGLMTSEHHGGFPGYIPNPLQLAGWLLEATDRIWAAPCPLLLPLFHWSHIAEALAWMAARFPGRVGGGFAIGGLAQDFEMADLDYADRVARFKEGLPLVVEALRGGAQEPLSLDPAIAACKETPVPTVSAAQSLGAVRRAAQVGIGVLYDSLQTVERMREISDAYEEAGGRGSRIAIRRVWIGAPPEAEVEAQMDFYRGYASQGAQAHWGEGQQLVTGANGGEVAEQLLEIAERGGCDAFNLRAHVKGIEPARVEEQIGRLGAETLPMLRKGLAA